MPGLMQKILNCLRWIRNGGDASKDLGILDALLVKKRNRIEVWNFYLGNLYKRHMSREQRLSYLGHWQVQTLLDVLNPVEHVQLCNDKVLQKALCQRAGVPVARSLGVLHSENGQAVDGAPLRNVAELTELLERAGIESCVLKLPCGLKGEGFLVFHAGSNELAQNDRYHIDCASTDDALPFLSSSGYLCEELIVQHPVMAQINPHAVSTFRVWTYKNGPTVSILGAFMRTSSSLIPVDNTSTGGLCVRVDVEKGQLVSDFFAPDMTFAEYPEHPVTQFAVKGMKVPYWERVLEMAETVASAYEHVRLIAMDVAITERGPVCVETNGKGDYQGQFLIGYGFGELPEAKELLRAGKL